MKWSTILNKWSKGIVPKLPPKVQSSHLKYMWNTSRLTQNGQSKFEQKFKINPYLAQNQDPSAFQQHFKQSTNQYVTSFPNLSGDTMLVVPMPRSGKNFSTINDFMANASMLQQREFWKCVSQVAQEELKKHPTLWISTHGAGVPYLHVRISSKPKYYFDNTFTYQKRK